MTGCKGVSSEGGAPLARLAWVATAATLAAGVAAAQVAKPLPPVTDEVLANPAPEDWLMYSRTYDAQRFSPLDQINRGNVAQLRKAWSVELPEGVVEIIPIVYEGVMYLSTPGGRGVGSGVWALDAATGEVLWKYEPDNDFSSRIKSIAIYQDLVFFTAPNARNRPNPVVALDAATGEVRWETPVTGEAHVAGAIVVEGKVISGRTCNRSREDCYIAAHDALTGEEVWRFHTSPGEGEPGDESWGGTPVNERRASTWGLPGTYDPARGLLYWGISNPMPNTRAARHDGNPRAIPPTAPADLYSNSTVALRPETGELAWYYQHLPGDDWDADINQEKMLIRTVVDPDPAHVRWINPNIPKGVERDVVITVGEGGGIWVNDRATGQFIWATPFPYETPNFILSDIDVETGAAHINWDVVLEEPGDQAIVCYWNTRSFWPTAYHAPTNSLYVPYVDHCLDMTRAGPDNDERRRGAPRPGSDPEKFAGLARIDMRTGAITRIYQGRVPGVGAVLATAGDVIFWGDIMHVLHAFDARNGAHLWQSEPLGAPVMTSTITYAVDGKQYVAVVNGEAQTGSRGLGRAAGIETPETVGNSINVFALPD